MITARKLNRLEFVEQYQSIEGMDKRKVLKEVDRLANKGWKRARTSGEPSNR